MVAVSPTLTEQREPLIARLSLFRRYLWNHPTRFRVTAYTKAADIARHKRSRAHPPPVVVEETSDKSPRPYHPSGCCMACRPTRYCLALTLRPATSVTDDLS